MRNRKKNRQEGENYVNDCKVKQGGWEKGGREEGGREGKERSKGTCKRKGG